MSGGRKKTMKTIQGADARQVAFSKRRSGLFKKGSELCTLCAFETALVVFSPSGKAFFFCHPCAATILDRLDDPGKLDAGMIQHAEADQGATLRELNKQYSDLLDQLGAEKKRGQKLKQMMAGQKQGWWDAPINELSLRELMSLKGSLEELKGRLNKRKEQLLLQASAATPSSSANSAGASDPSVTNPAEGNSSVDPHGNGVCHGHQFM